MRILKNIQPLDNYFLLCEFNDGTIKKADIKPFLNSEAFAPLKDFDTFSQVKSNDYYVSWLKEQIDLSADTLWHIGKA